MNDLTFLSSPVADALGWTLLHATWQGFALVLPAAILLHLLRNQSGSVRYRLGTLTLLAQLVASVATFIWYYEPNASTLFAPATVSTGAHLPMRWLPMTQTLPWHQQMQLFLENHLSQFVLIYLIGVALFGLRLAGGWLYLQRLSQTARKPTTVAWVHLTDQLRSLLSIKVAIQVRESARIAVPMVVGVLKPVLLLPIGLATHLTVREVEMVLAHELAHVKRHDYAVNLLQSVVEVLYFFHPALWWLSARVREEREHCCDDLAVQACGGDGRILAQALARVEELRLNQLGTPALAMAFASKRQHLLHRIRRMLGAPTQPFVSNGSLTGLTLATILFMSVSVYAVQKQDNSGHKTTQPQPKATRKHKIDSKSEYGMVDNKKISYIIWKGRKLSAARVARLQHQLDQVMAGQRSLDDVPQADRDILLTIIEKNNSFNEGMEALTNGLAHIDYDNIVASALNNVPLSPDGSVEGLAKVDYEGIIGDAFASLSDSMLDTLDRLKTLQRLQMDSIPNRLESKLVNLRDKDAQLRSQINEYEQAMKTYSDQMSEPIKQYQRMMADYMDLQKQLALVRKQASRPDLLPLKNTLLTEISATETNLTELNQRLKDLTHDQIHPYSDKMAEAFKKMRILMDSIRTTEEQLVKLMPDEPESPEAPESPDVPEAAPRPARAPRIMRTPRPAIAPNAVYPAIPAAPAQAPTVSAPAAPRAKNARPLLPKSPVVPKLEND